MGADGVAQQIQFNVAGSGPRWKLGKGADNNFELARYDSSGTFVENSMVVQQSDGRVGIGGSPTGKLHVESDASEIMLSLINNNPALGAGGLIKLLTAYETPVNSLQMGYKSDTTVRYNVKTDGTTEWGPGGSGSRDTNLYRSAANVLRTSDQFVADDGVTTKTRAGAITDANFTVTPASGTIAVDTANSKLYVRVGSTWKSVALT